MSASERAASMSPDELIAVIARGLEADEQAARALGGDWMCLTVPGFSLPGDPGEVELGDGGPILAMPTTETAWHIARHDPARVLADVAAKREILAEYESLGEDFDESSDVERAYMTSMTGVLRSLARPYLDQEMPGYAVIIDGQGQELSERMNGVCHLLRHGDQITLRFASAGDGGFKISTPGVACTIRYRLASGLQVEDDRPFVAQADD